MHTALARARERELEWMEEIKNLKKELRDAKKELLELKKERENNYTNGKGKYFEEKRTEKTSGPSENEN